MPKVKKRELKNGKFEYKYKCKCGREVTLETDVKPKKLIKCLSCSIEDNDIIPLEAGMI